MITKSDQEQSIYSYIFIIITNMYCRHWMKTETDFKLVKTFYDDNSFFFLDYPDS